ncbi:MAG TPA: tetratricopeptide repeat protein [Pirellulales bacterium]
MMFFRFRRSTLGASSLVSFTLSAAVVAPLGLTLNPASLVAQEPAELKAESGGPRGSLVEDRAARKLIEAGDARYEVDEQLKAVEIWQSVIERYPRSKHRFEAHMRLGNHLLERERAYDRARPHFEIVAGEDNRDEEARAEALLKSGRCFYEAGNYGKSFSVMRGVIEKFPVSPQVNLAHYYIGLGHFQLGHYSRAIAALEKVGTALTENDAKVEKVEAGKRLFVKVEDADLAVLEPGQAIPVLCRTTQGDEEIVACLPVGRNVRVVLGSIPTTLGKPVPKDGRLQVRGDDEVTILYTDSHTADRQFNREVPRKIQVVGDALPAIMDGAYGESLGGVVLGREMNVQVIDFDRDLTDQAEKLKVVVEVWREKTQAELDADLAAQASAEKPATPDAPGAEPARELELPKDKLVDRVEVELVEAKVLPNVREKITPDAESDGPADSVSPTAAPTPGVPALPTGPGESPTSAPAPKSPAAAKTPATGEAKPGEKVASKPLVVEPPPPVDDGTIHSGVFRGQVSVAKIDTAIAGDAILQALPSDRVRIVYLDDRNMTDDPREVVASARAMEGNLGGVRVTKADISDQELRVRTQLKTADALTNIGNRYKEFGLKKNADGKYGEALNVCEDVVGEAQLIGGRLLEETYVQLWRIYYEMDRLELAAAMCERLQREFPNSGFVDDALLQLADVVRKQGDLNRAIGIYTRLVQMQSSQLRGEAQFGVAACYEEMAAKATGPAGTQLFDRAFQEYKKVFDHFPESGRVGEAVAKMANYYYQQKDYARAIDIFDSVLQQHPDAKFLDVILFNYGRCLYRMDRKPEARKQFDQLIADFPESPLAEEAKKIAEALSAKGF